MQKKCKYKPINLDAAFIYFKFEQKPNKPLQCQDYTSKRLKRDNEQTLIGKYQILACFRNNSGECDAFNVNYGKSINHLRRDITNKRKCF